MHIFFFSGVNLKRLAGIISLPLVLICLNLVLSACGEQNQSYELGIYLDSPFLSEKVDGLKEGLKALGYSDGSTIRYQALNSQDASPDQLPSKLKDFVAKDYPAYWTSSNRGALQLKQAGVKKPIIVAGLANPVQSGLIKSYYQPTTNLNGVDSLDTELTLNRLNLLLSFDPSIRKIYLLHDPSNQADVNYLQTVRTETARLGVSLLEKPISGKDASKDILTQLKASEARAILPLGDILSPDKIDLDLLKSVITTEKLVLVGKDRSDLALGAFFIYGSDFKAMGRQSAAYIDRAFHGVNIATQPILQPTQLELVLNQKIAPQIGRKFTDEEIATADEVIN